MKLSQELKIFSQVFTGFVKSTFSLRHFPKERSLIPYLFPELWTGK